MNFYHPAEGIQLPWRRATLEVFIALTQWVKGGMVSFGSCPFWDRAVAGTRGRTTCRFDDDRSSGFVGVEATIQGVVQGAFIEGSLCGEEEPVQQNLHGVLRAGTEALGLTETQTRQDVRSSCPA